MNRIALAGLLVGLALLTGCRTPGPSVRVTLNDGQTLVGKLTTKSIALKTGMGDLTFDTAVAGELGLVEGESVKQSGNMIRLWLRNGSEFVGKWQEPSVEVEIETGETHQTINVPINLVKRLQFQGDPIWADDAVFRIVTKDGDDFFVDVTRTRMTFQTNLGKFNPVLSEIERLEPMDDKKEKWRIKMRSGTVLQGTLQDRELDLRLAVGPERLQLPLSAIKQMARQQLHADDALDMSSQQRLRSTNGMMLSTDQAPAPGFYSNKGQKAAKRRAAQEWQQGGK